MKAQALEQFSFLESCWDSWIISRKESTSDTAVPGRPHLIMQTAMSAINENGLGRCKINELNHWGFSQAKTKDFNAINHGSS